MRSRRAEEEKEAAVGADERPFVLRVYLAAMDRGRIECPVSIAMVQWAVQHHVTFPMLSMFSKVINLLSQFNNNSLR
ncbi:hypothetical protein Trydic_g12797 [Trypoxylus dichotomus]